MEMIHQLFRNIVYIKKKKEEFNRNFIVKVYFLVEQNYFSTKMVLVISSN